MNENSRPVSITILDKEYLISCPDEEREQLHAAAKFLNNKLMEMKNGGKVIGSERIAIMTALNIASEYLSYKQENSDYTVTMDTTIKRLQDKINKALVEDRQFEH